MAQFSESIFPTWFGKNLKSSTRWLSIVYINNIAVRLAMMDHRMMVEQSDSQRTQTMHQKDN